MSADQYLARLSCRDELNDSPLSATVVPYVEALLVQRYAKRTIGLYLHALAHFGHWMKTEALCVESIDAALTERFVREHLPACTCSMSLHSGTVNTRAALRHLLKLLAQRRPVKSSTDDPITTELDRFGDYLQNICGVAPQTNARRCKDVGVLLVYCFGAEPLVLSPLSVAQIDAFVATLIPRLRPASLRTGCNSLRSYFRFRALLGESTDALSASLPRVADWRHATLPKALSDAQLAAFLKVFDCSNPVELRDYAIARCLLDLGLRGDEVAHLTLQSVDWRNGTLTLGTSKSKRVQQLPLPVPTGEAIARYLRQGRPQTTDRNLFVRHRAPVGIPLSVAALRSAMNRAFVRCGLRDQFCNTHVLRRTTATRLQRAGASVKEIADLLRHRSIDTASAYARVDLEGLRAVALPWPGSRS
ncbi:tyrosine-type recombinase/integrase [Pseudomonas mandelii]|jgi:integrase/recombinase XerD|uniref:site-specific integrase n=1 Tax=Pseudomonas TaxID=286 RepID=UPI0003432A2A|nr:MULTISPECIES: site-specific integrase [unclassified Pseudomonas]EPA95337.1 integrase/recombinase [Pseudomonas sp. G5(2012)]OOL37076.1 integrase [Pseudomonas sp. FSL W5-0299]